MIRDLFKKIYTSLPFLFISITISCMILLLSATFTLRKETLKNIESMGANKLALWIEIFDKKSSKIVGRITLRDIQLIKRRCREIKAISLERTDISTGGPMAIETKGWNFERWMRYLPPAYLMGITPGYKKVESLKLTSGRFINELDLKMKRKVCVLGNTFYLLLGGKKILNKDIKVEAYPGVSFKVIGGLARHKPFSRDFWHEECLVNAVVFIPYTTLEEIALPTEKRWEDILLTIKTDGAKEKKGKGFQQGNKEERWNPMLFEEDPQRSELTEKEAKDILGLRFEQVNRVKNKILDLLYERYGQDKKFHIFPRGKRLLEELEEQSQAFNAFIINIGLATLLASIIGILSIMLLSVHNRTSEIGLRRAIGARKKDIFLQFLKEAFVITTKGGVGGIILGLFLVWLMGKYTGWDMVIPIYSLFLSIATIALIGIISGTYPAIKAANIPPAIAVKYE
ncbi:MAG: ABC transporter permease [bacterium]